MKYDQVDVDAGGNETSHSLVVRLVGSGHRVLDVGCSTGYLAAALNQRANTVSGVEVDPEAAERARPHLERVEIADLDEADLGQLFEPGSFDVVVFADVLEHLKDPARTLRQARSLLADGGYVVVSIPNIAHASVRLALLEGRFEYTPVGLLDDTHLRFFTRDTLQKLFREAGMVLVDLQRTIAGPFDTEIELDRAAFSPEVVARIEQDEESRTYQFVAKVVPRAFAVGQGREADRLLDDLWEAKARLARIIAALRVAPGRPAIAVVAGDGAGLNGFMAQLRQAVAVAELRRRMTGVDVRACWLGPEPVPSPVTGEPVWPLGPRAEFASEVLRDAVGVLVAFEGSGPLFEAVAERFPSAVAMTGSDKYVPGEGPDPLLLAERVLDPAVLGGRVAWLRTTGLLPQREPYIAVLVHSTSSGGSPDAYARSTGRPAVDLAATTGTLDLSAVIAGAELVITDDRAVAALATGLSRPVAVVGPLGDGRVAWADQLDVPVLDAGHEFGLPDPLERTGRPSRSRVTPQETALDLLFDELETSFADAVAAHVVGHADDRIRAMAHRISVLEATNAGLRAAMDHERRTLLEHAATSPGVAPPATGSLHPPRSRLTQGEVLRLNEEIAELKAEIDRIYATKLMRAAQPARQLYSRLRRLER